MQKGWRELRKGLEEPWKLEFSSLSVQAVLTRCQTC
jgi:hypothetical protein